MKDRTILTNITEYFVSDADVDNLLYQAKEFDIKEILLGPSSILRIRERARKFQLQIDAGISYPSGAYNTDAKVEEIQELEALCPEIARYFVVIAEGMYLSRGVEYLNEEIVQLRKAASGKEVILIAEISRIIKSGRLKEFAEACEKQNVAGVMISTGFYPYKESFPTIDDAKACRKALDGSVMLVGAGINAKDAVAAGCNKILLQRPVEQ